MANSRSTIRTAVQGQLVDAEIEGVGSNIFTSRDSKIWASELPCIIISTPEERNTPENLSGRRYIRDVQLVIEIRCKATENVDTNLDSLVVEVENAIDEDPKFSGSVLSSIQQSTETRIDSEGEEDIGIAIVTFECKYIA